MAFNSYFVVTILVIINLLNYMDRYTIAGVLSEIKTYFDLNNASTGLLQTAFIVSYMLFSPVFGFLGDRYSRKYVIIFGVAFWSTVTLISSFVQPHHALWFFFFRALVGIGEASYSTVASTLIADLFIGTQRSTMLAIFYFAIPVGSGLGYIVGITMARAFHHWTWSLRLTPIFGFISVFLFMFIEEPKRGAMEQQHDSEDELSRQEPTGQQQPQGIGTVIHSLTDDAVYLFSIPTFVFTTLGFTSVCFSVGALSWWAPSFMKYANPESKDETIGLIFGAIACLGGIAGILIGWGASRYLRPKYPTADAWICAIGVALSIPCVFLGILLSRVAQGAAWFFIFLAITFLSTNWSVVVDILLYVIVPKRRSTAQAIQILTSHILGDAVSPFIIGEVSDLISKDLSVDKNYRSLSYALYLTPLVLIFGVFFFVISSRYLIRDEQKCKASVSGGSNNPSDDGLSSTIPSSRSDSTHNLIINSNQISAVSLHQRSDYRSVT